MKECRIIISCLMMIIYSQSVVAKKPLECDDQCTFVLLNEESGEYSITNEKRAVLRMSPFSTFKIPHTLAALEMGIVQGLNQLLSFDREVYEIQDWWPKSWYERPLNIKDAFSYSAVPIYRSIASSIGERRMKGYVSKLKYGNEDTSSGLDSFWLGGSLKISTVEQVDFLKAVFNNKTSVDKSILSAFKSIMLVEESVEHKLYVKTGAGHVEGGTFLGWYVGAIESKKGMHYFALNISGNTFLEIKDRREKLARKLLIQAGVI